MQQSAAMTHSGNFLVADGETSVARARRFRLGLGRRGAVAMLVGLSAPMLLMAISLGVEVASWTVTQQKLQRTADATALSAVEAYYRGASAQTAATYGAYVAEMNNASAGTSRSWVGSTLTDGNITVQKTNGVVNSSDTAFVATIKANVPLLFSKYVLGSGTTTRTLTATSTAEIEGGGAVACIIALGTSSSGITLSGGTSVTASNCAVASNTSVSAPCGTSIVTKTVDYDSSAPSSCTSTSNITPPAGTASVNIVKVATSDPLAANTDVIAAFAHLTSVASLTGPAAPTVSAGTAINLGYSPTSMSVGGCTGTMSSNTWTFICPAGGTYHFGSLTVGGGLSLSFAMGTNGSATNVYDFSGAINNGGSAASFGPGTYNIAGGIYTGGGTTTSFGAGTYNIGAGTVSCSGSYYSICNTGSTLTFGAGAYSIAGGVYNASTTLTFGSGSTANSFTIGHGSAGYAINGGGSSITTFGNMASGTFQAVGAISTSGGSSLTLSAAPAHDLNGAFSLAGSATLGAGTYTVAGNFALGAGGGGGTVTGTGVSIITSGSFSVAAGYSSVTLTAPTSGALLDLVVAGNGAGGASFSEGASGNSLSGAFYFPSGPISLSGGASVGNGTGQCLELIGLNVSLTGGSALASTCVGLAGGSTGVTTMVLAR
jgi:Flp pilus assembly protein TadG